MFQSLGDGDFEFNGLPGSSFLVVITHPDYEPYQERVEFLSEASETRPGETRTVEMTLTPKPTAAFAPGRVTFAQAVPPAALAAFERGAKLSREGKPREAAAELREAVRLFPDYCEGHFTLGAELLKAGDQQEAAVDESESQSHRIRYPTPGSVISTGGSPSFRRNFRIVIRTACVNGSAFSSHAFSSSCSADTAVPSARSNSASTANSLRDNGT